MGAMLGDIGKIFIPSKILYKPGKLTEQEYTIIKKHSSYSSKYLEKYGKFEDATHRAAVEHHERVDGTGYPHGLTGDKISMAGQITAIADTYDAMTSVRLHQERKEPTQTLKYMLSKRGELFDEGLVKRFIQCLGVYPVGTLVALNNGFIGVVLEQNIENVMQPVVRLLYDLKKKRTIRPFKDVNILSAANDSGLKVISDVSKSKFSFHPLSAIG
jgi:HD-GYP domain-containing protein (c-di-GMP phosphodiesterase class II)